MSWDERQRGMLAAMGLRVWSAPAVAEPVSEAEAEVAVAEPPLAAPALAALPPALRRPAAPAVRQQAIAQLDGPELLHSAAECRACALCEGRQRSVFGPAPLRSDWLVLGEAPTEAEDQQGTPLVGEAGQLLDNMMLALGLRRAGTELRPPERQFYVTNAVKCRPPPSRSPGVAELQQCAPYLARQIALVQPRVILAMGRLAVQALLGGSEALGKLRGQVHDFQGIPVIVSYPTSYLLRNLPDKAGAWEDLCLAHEALLASAR